MSGLLYTSADVDVRDLYCVESPYIMKGEDLPGAVLNRSANVLGGDNAAWLAYGNSFRSRQKRVRRPGVPPTSPDKSDHLSPAPTAWQSQNRSPWRTGASGTNSSDLLGRSPCPGGPGPGLGACPTARTGDSPELEPSGRRRGGARRLLLPGGLRVGTTPAMLRRLETLGFLSCRPTSGPKQAALDWLFPSETYWNLTPEGLAWLHVRRPRVRILSEAEYQARERDQALPARGWPCLRELGSDCGGAPAGFAGGGRESRSGRSSPVAATQPPAAANRTSTRMYAP